MLTTGFGKDVDLDLQESAVLRQGQTQVTCAHLSIHPPP